MPGEGRVTKNRIDLVRLLSIAFVVLISDQIAKRVVLNAISLGSSIPVIKNIFHLTPIFNKGAAFGILKTQGPFFIVISIVAASFIIFYILRFKNEAALIKVAFGLILGGIFGNMVDRLRFGYVVDFLDFRVWPVFNIADSAITIGAALICIQLLKIKTKN